MKENKHRMRGVESTHIETRGHAVSKASKSKASVFRARRGGECEACGETISKGMWATMNHGRFVHPRCVSI